METQRFPQNLLTAIFLSTEKIKILPTLISQTLSGWPPFSRTLIVNIQDQDPPLCQASAITSECPHIPACHLSSQVLIIKQRDKQTAAQMCTTLSEGKEHHLGRQV